MTSLYEKQSVVIRPRMGTDIWSVIRAALVLSLEQGCPVEFIFNDKHVEVNPSPFIAEIHRKWSENQS